MTALSIVSIGLEGVLGQVEVVGDLAPRELAGSSPTERPPLARHQHDTDRAVLPASRVRAASMSSGPLVLIALRTSGRFRRISPIGPRLRSSMRHGLEDTGVGRQESGRMARADRRFLVGNAWLTLSKRRTGWCEAA